MANVEQLEARTLFVGTLEIAPDVGGMVYDRTGTVVLVTSGTTLQAYSAATGVPGGSIAVGRDLGGLDLTPDGSTAYITDRHPAFDGDPHQAVVYKVDVTTDAVTPIPYPLTPPEWGHGGGSNVAVMSNGKAFVVSEAPSAPLREIDLSTGDVRVVGEVSGGGAVLARSADRNTLFLRRDDGDVLYDARDGSFTRRPGGPQPEAFAAVAPDGSYIAAGSTVLDRAFNVVARINASDFPGAFDPVDSLLYTVNWVNATGEITGVDTRTWRKQFSFYPGHPYSTVPRDPAITLMQVSPDGSGMLLRKGALGGEAVGISRVNFTAEPAIAPTVPAVRPGTPVAFSFGKFARPGAPLKAFSGTLRFSSDDPAAELPPDTRVDLHDGEDADFFATLHTPGHHWLTVTVLETGATSSRSIHLDNTPPTARVERAYKSYLPGHDNLYRVEAELVDDDEIDWRSEQDGDPEVVAVGPDGTVYPVMGGIFFPPEPPNAMCTGHCPSANDWTYGFYPERAGRYVLRLLPGSVTDRAGNAAAGADLGVVEVEGTFDLAATLQTIAPRTPASRKVGSVLTIGNAGRWTVEGAVIITLAAVPAEAGGAADLADGRALVERQQKLRLAAGKSRRVKFNLALPGDLPPGSYRLVARVTPAAGMPTIERSRANNTAVAEPFPLGSSGAVAGRPSLVASVDPRVVRVRPRAPVTLAVELLNVGDAPASGRHTVAVVGTDAAGNSVRFAPLTKSVRLAPGESRRLVLRLRAPIDALDAELSLQASVIQA